MRGTVVEAVTGTGCKPRVVVIGSSMHFVSGISYYTYYLSQALAARADTSVVLMRRLVPRLLYPGRRRVGRPISGLDTAEFAPTFNGVDWFLLPSLPRAVEFIRRADPQVLILQWWSGSALPAYMTFAMWARRRNVPVVIELHEVMDTAEARVPVLGRVAAACFRWLLRQGAAFVVHSAWDAEVFVSRYGLDPDTVTVVTHGPYPSRAGSAVTPSPGEGEGDEVRVLFFGTIRPYKGLEVLVEAFERLDPGLAKWKLTVVGETWEGWRLPISLIMKSARINDITLVNRYVTDDEADRYFGEADIVALPYLRSSASGPLAMAIARGLPVVTTDVGGLTEFASSYPGAVLVSAGDPVALAAGLEAALPLVGVHHHSRASWDDSAGRLQGIVERLVLHRSSPKPPG